MRVGSSPDGDQDVLAYLLNQAFNLEPSFRNFDGKPFHGVGEIL